MANKGSTIRCQSFIQPAAWKTPAVTIPVKAAPKGLLSKKLRMVAAKLRMVAAGAVAAGAVAAGAVAAGADAFVKDYTADRSTWLCARL